MNWFWIFLIPAAMLGYLAIRRIRNRPPVTQRSLRRARHDVDQWLIQLDQPQQHRTACRCPVCLEARRSQAKSLDKAA